MSTAFQTIKQEAGKVEPEDLAYYILAKLGVMDHLKLQKLLYYVQSWHLAILGIPIFDEDFKAWVHGPVLTSVWHALKDHSKLNAKFKLNSASVSKVIAKVEDCLQKDQVDVIADVLEEYGQRSGYHLECLTHSEDPWKNARGDLSPDAKSAARISKASMRKFYAARLTA
jgi:uncharacterized phage-associated protein